MTTISGAKLHKSKWPVIPLKPASKAPGFANWQNGITHEQAASNTWNGNIGLLAEHFPGVDIDITDPACASAIEVALETELGKAPVRIGAWPKRLMMYRTDKPFNKVKVFLSGPNGDKNKAGKSFAVEFLATGQQYVIYGEHPDGHTYRWIDDLGPVALEPGQLVSITNDDVNRFIASLPAYLPNGWSIQSGQGSTNQSSQDALALYKPPLLGWDIDRVQSELLNKLDPSCDYDEWVRIGLALHHQGNGDEMWLFAWDHWSSSASNYQAGLCKSKWESFSNQRPSGHGPVTLASLIKHAGLVTKKELDALFDTLRTAIEQSQDTDTLKVVVESVRNESRIDHVSRGVLAHVLKKRFKDLAFPVSIGDCKNMIRPRNSDGSAGTPEWLNDWVYVTHEDKFFNVVSKRRVTSSGFAAMFNRFTGTDSAAVLALTIWNIPTPDKAIYLPSANNIFELDGLPCVNEYDQNSPPDIPLSYSSGDLAAIEKVKTHVQLLLGSTESANVLIDWMAYNVQKPGLKINWAPLIKGIEGTGKSFIGVLMGAVMGRVNVGEVPVDQLGSGFTNWAVGRCVNVLEEIRMVGHNRHDILNKIKPYITNESISVNPKGVNVYISPNTVNYIAFTNHADALPLDDTDRRWWVQFCPFTTAEELYRATGEGYFIKLFDSARYHAPALRKWLLEHEISESFSADGRAPSSSAKAQMVGLNTSDELEAAKDLIDIGGPGFNSNIISSAHFIRALNLVEGIEPVKKKAVNLLISKLGFMLYEKRVKWRAEMCKIWIHISYQREFGPNKLANGSGNLANGSGNHHEFNEKIRELLDATLVDDVLG